MNELLAQFVAEARDLLAEAGEDLLALERTPDDQTAINRLFRSVHTLKGSSGLFEVAPLTRILHAGEDMFQAVREHGLALTPEMVDAALQVFDQVGRWIEALDRHAELPADAEPISRVVAAELRACFAPRESTTAAAAAAGPASGAPAHPSVAPADLTRWFGSAAVLAAAAAAGRGTLNLVAYQPETGCFFKGEDPLHLVLQVPQLQALGAAPRLPWTPIAEFDPFCCMIEFFALSTAGHDELAALFRYVPEQVTITALTAAGLLSPAAAPPHRGLPADSPDAFATVLLREQFALLGMAAPADELAGRMASAALVAANVLRFAGRPEDAAMVAAAGTAALAAGQPDALTAAIGLLVSDAAAADPDPAAEPDGPVSRTAAPAAAEGGERTVPRVLKVDQEKVDTLMNLVGELVVAKNSLPFLARRAEHQFGLRELGREIKDQYGVIDRIAQELQSAIMAIRMMPVGQVFQRFPRLVRDLSRKLGKQVDLVIEGESTEADKNVIETLFDPILHMVRNSLDHGVETPEQRTACGKPGVATVRLAARHDGDQVVIEVIDDGRGIDPEVIKRRAYERGMLDEAGLAEISDHDATMLVFAAGFSTAETVSDVSGRGVGMDVVRNAVERAGGRIAMTSVKGSGTTVRLNLPLSMAVSRVMTVGLDDRLFGIPMDLIHETVRVPRRDIVRIKNREAFVLRDRVVPLLHLAELLQLDEPANDTDSVAVLVVQVSGHTIGLGVSAFGEGMEVILKPLEGMLAKIAGYMGTALLGDGRVLLVLDLKELIP